MRSHTHTHQHTHTHTAHTHAHTPHTPTHTRAHTAHEHTPHTHTCTHTTHTPTHTRAHTAHEHTHRHTPRTPHNRQLCICILVLYLTSTGWMRLAWGSVRTMLLGETHWGDTVPCVVQPNGALVTRPHTTPSCQTCSTSTCCGCVCPCMHFLVVCNDGFYPSASVGMVTA